MIYQDNDTLNAAQQNKKQSQEDKLNNKNAMTAKLLASVTAGLALGVGATYAAEQLSATDTVENTDVEPQETTTVSAPEQTTKPNLEERVSKLEEKERIREKSEHTQQKQEPENHQPKPQKPEHSGEHKDDDNNNGNVLNGHDVKIESVETRTLDDGATVQIYSGTIDGHQAAFMANGNGQVVAAIVDANDNGNVDENEVIDLRESNMTTQYLAQHQVTPENDHNVEVVAVEHNVELGGETVDVAIVSIDEQPVMFVDSNQNGEVDVAIVDQNNNGALDEGEVQDVSNAHIAMPTEDDITGNSMMASAEDNTEDYSNNSDVTVYDV